MKMKRYVILAVLALALGVTGFVIVRYYEFVFAKTVKGTILNIEKVSPSQAIITGAAAVPAAQLFSFAVSIKDDSGEIHTASSEDRQWAVAQPGQCVEARFFPYPPWNLEKANTFHDARLEHLYECKK